MAGRVAALARVLADLGVGRGDRVGIWLPRSREAAEAFLATTLRGAVALLVHPAWTRDMAVRALRAAPVEVLLSTARFARSLADRTDFAAPRSVVTPDGPPGLLWPERPEHRGPPEGLARAEDTAAILPVPGEEGGLLGAMLSHAGLVSGATGLARHIGLSAADRVLYFGSLASGCGLEHVAAALSAGSALVLETSPMMADILDAVATKEATVLPGRPEVFRDLLSALRHRSEPLPRLRAAVCAGAALPPPLVSSFLARLPGTALHLTYGLTEGQRVSAVPPERLPAAAGTLGVTLPGVEVLLVDGAGGVGEEGEIAVRGPQVFSGYLGDEAATKRRLRPLAGGGPALLTGDFGRREGGLLRLTGRRSTPLRSGGERVDGEEVRRALLSCDLVAAVSLAGGVEDDGLDCVRAAVTFRPGVPPDLPAVRAHLRRRLPPFMLPVLHVTHPGPGPEPPS
jgi:acyl-CoA synthetase (AMP-forming)/AMP-acid ligase II